MGLDIHKNVFASRFHLAGQLLPQDRAGRNRLYTMAFMLALSGFHIHSYGGRAHEFRCGCFGAFDQQPQAE